MRYKYTNFSQIKQVQDVATSHYSALQVGLEKRPSRLPSAIKLHLVANDRCGRLRRSFIRVERKRFVGYSPWLRLIESQLSIDLGHQPYLRSVQVREPQLADQEHAGRLGSERLGLIKNWDYEQRYKLQFRVEMFNALNHPSFGQPDSNAGDANFGQITSTGVIPALVIQDGLKLNF